MNRIHFKEIKYVSHILRNFYLYFILFLTYYLIYGFQPSISRFFTGLFIFAASYSPVYFLNDYADRKEDAEMGKSNLYSSIKSKRVFWATATLLIMFGLVSTYIVSFSAFLWILLLYFLNCLYSFKPLRLRDISFAKEANIFAIYFVKWFFISELLGFRLGSTVPLFLFMMGSAYAAVNLVLYKRHHEKDKFSEYFFGFIFLVSLLVSMILYKEIIILSFPLLPFAIYLSAKFKKEQIPIGKYQLLYFLYAAAVYIVALVARSPI